MWRSRRHLRAEHARLPRRRHDEAHQNGNGRRLARAVAAEKRGDRARLEREAEAVDGGHLAERLDEPTRDHGRRGTPRVSATSRSMGVDCASSRVVSGWARLGSRADAGAVAALCGAASVRWQGGRECHSVTGLEGAIRAPRSGSQEHGFADMLSLNQDPVLIADADSRLRLQTIVRLRWLGVLGQIVAVGVVSLGIGLRHAGRPLPRLHRDVGMAQRLPRGPLPGALPAVGPFATVTARL